MSPQKNKDTIVKSVYFSNWSDQLGYPVAYRIMPYIAKIPGANPNSITLFSFVIYSLGAILLFLDLPFNNLLAGIFILAGYIGDNLDGQLARYKKMSSNFGDFLDKTIDVLKIFIITASLGYASYLKTQSAIYILLAFAACFFFNWRYYIKLETIFQRVNIEKDYLKKSAQKRQELLEKISLIQKKNKKSLVGKVKNFWFYNRLFFLNDEAEIAVVTALGAFFNKIEIVLIYITLTQIIIGFWRFGERLNQIKTSSPRLLWPMRK